MFNTRLVALTIGCLFLASNYQLVSPFRAARLLSEDPPADNGPSKVPAVGSQPRRDGSWTGNTSPTAGTMPPPPTSTTKFVYDSKTVNATSPSSSHVSTTSTAKTITQSNVKSPNRDTTNTTETTTSTATTINRSNVNSPTCVITNPTATANCPSVGSP